MDYCVSRQNGRQQQPAKPTQIHARPLSSRPPLAAVMGPSLDAAESPPPFPTEKADNDLQPFYVLHKASSQKSDRKSIRPVSARRKIHLPPSSPKKAERVEEDEDRHEQLRMDAYEFVWSKIESTIKDVLRGINTNVFNEINSWICESFKVIRSCGTPGFAEATRSFPIVTDASSKQLFTGLIMTKNMEFVDDLLTFEELGIHLKSHGCHVANLSSLDFMAKNGISGCLRSLLRQFLKATFDAADISILAAWYREQGNDDTPIIVIIDDMERCCGSVLSDFIYMLSEWVVKIPIILLVGVATTLDAPKNVLSSNALQLLCPCKFILGSPAERMDAIVKAVLVEQCFGFSIGHKVAVFLKNYFLNQDGTLSSFIRALKIACVQHFSLEPLSFMLQWLLVEEDNKRLCNDNHALSLELMIKNASGLPSHVRNILDEAGVEKLSHGLVELKRSQEQWSIVLLFLFEAGKFNKIQLLDLLCEALDPDRYNSSLLKLDNDYGKSPSGHCSTQQYPTLRKGGFICQAVRKVRDLPATQLCQLLKSWEKLSMDAHEICDKVRELQSMLKLEDDKSLKQDLSDASKRHSSWTNEKGSKAVNSGAVKVIECLVRDYLQPIECKQFHEIVCFKNIDKLHLALVGDPRKQIQVDLLEFQKILRCSCCSWSNNVALPSMHDTSIMYTLAQEHGDLINLHDWYQSFKTVIELKSKGKRKLKQSPLKKRKEMHESESQSEALVQARFCRGVIELQITGLLRMPSKRRPDFVQRVAFGL